MARTLPGGMAANITATGQQPEISVTVQDLQERLTSYASGGTAGRSSAILSSTNHIIRAVCAQAAATNQSITVQNITPGTPASWTAAATTITTNAVARAGCCLVQTGATTRCFYQRTADNYICYRDSTDDGVTWGAETLVLASMPLAGADIYCYGIAADTTTNLWIGTAAFDPNGMCTISRTSYSGAWSAWSNEGPATPAWGQLRGMACSAAFATRRFVCGVGMRGYTSGISAGWFTWTGAAYSAMSYLQQMDNPTQGLSLAYPDLFYDASNLYGDAKQWYAVVTMTDDGSVSTSAHTRTTVYRSTDGATWRPWVNAGTGFSYGGHVIITGGVIYLFDAVNVYTIPGPPAAVDLTNDVAFLEIVEDYNQPAAMRLTLNNIGGQYTGASWLIDNATLTLKLGYSGQTVTTHTFYIDHWELQATPEALQVQIAGRNVLKLLDYPSTLMLAYSSQTLSSIITALMAQAQVALATLPATTQFSQTVDCFMVTPGETWLSALNRLANLYGFNFRGDATPQVFVFEPAANDPGTWSYSTEALATAYGKDSNVPNVIRVTGNTNSTSSAWAEVIDQTNLLLVGSERYKLIVDNLLSTSAQCLVRAQLELRQEQRSTLSGELIVAMNPQHEVGDVITYTDAGIGVSGTAMRIRAMHWAIAPANEDWTHTLSLEAP